MYHLRPPLTLTSESDNNSYTPNHESADYPNVKPLMDRVREYLTTVPEEDKPKPNPNPDQVIPSTSTKNNT